MNRYICILIFALGMLHGGVQLAIAPLFQSHTTAATIYAYNAALTRGASHEIARCFAYAYAKASPTKVSPELAASVAAVESDFTPKAKSVKGAIGVMQVMPRAWNTTATKMLQIEPNIVKGIGILDYNIKRFGLAGGLHAYNLGSGDYTRGRRNYKYVANVLTAVVQKAG